MNRVFLLSLLLAGTAWAGPVNWNQPISGNATFNFHDAARWTGGFPANGSNVFLVWTGSSGGNVTQTVTNSPTNVILADSLTITNAVGANNKSAVIIIRGQTFLTNGVGALNFAGVTGGNANSDVSLTFQSNLTFKVLNMTGAGGSGEGTLTLAGATQGGDIHFNGGTGNSFLHLTGPLGLTGTLTVTNLNASSRGTLSGNATVAGVMLNNTANNRFTIVGATLNLTGAVASVAGGFTLANTATLNLSGPGGLIFSNVAPLISGTLNVANQTLLAKTHWANNGTVTLAGGTLAGNNLTNTSSGTVAGTGFIQNLLVNQGRVDFSGAIQTNLVQTAGSFTLNGAATITGTATISGGTLDLTGQQLTAANLIISGTGVFTNAIAGAIFSGTLSNASRLGLTADTTFNGSFVNSATASVAASTLTVTPAWQNAGTVLLDNGTLAGGTVTNAGLMRGAGTYAAVVANLGTIVATNGTASFLQSWQNAGTLQLHGGTVSGAPLTNAGTVTGRGTISAPLVNLNGSTLTAAGGGTLALTVAPSQAGAVNVLGTLQSTPAWANLAGGVVTLAGGTLTGGTLTNFGTLAGHGTVDSLVVNHGWVDVTGALQVIPAWGNDGTLQVAGALSGGTLTNLGTVTGAGVINTLFVNQNRAHFGGTVSNSLQQTAGSFTVAGSATITGAATITGGALDLQGGRLTAASLNISGTGRLTNAVTGATVVGNVNNAATLSFTADTYLPGLVTNSGAFYFRGAISNNLVNAGTVTLNGAATVTGTLVVNAGTVNLNASPLLVGGLAGSGGTISDNSGGGGTTTVTVAQAGNTTFGGVIRDGPSKSLALVKSGAGTLTLNGVNTFTGGTEVNGGTLKLGVANALPDSQAVLVNGGTFDLSGFDYALGGITLVSGHIVTGTLTGDFYDVRSGLITAALAGSAGLQKSTAGTVTLAGNNTYTGGSTVLGGTLVLGGNERLANSGTLTVTGGAFNLGGFQETVGAVQLTGGTITNGTLTGSAYLLQSGMIAGVLAGSATATKSGAGTVWLNSASTYTGDTTVQAGTLKVNNTTGSGTGGGMVHVLNGATLSGNGTIGGGVTIYSGGRLAPGNSVGTNYEASLTLNVGSILDYEFKTDLSANDLTIVTTSGGLTINGGGFNLYQDGTATPFDNPGIFQLIGYSGSIGGAGISALSVLNPTLNRAYNFATGGGYVLLNITGIRGWDGEAVAGGDSHWMTALNWGGDTAPVPNDHLLFDGFTGLSNTNNFAAYTRFSGFTFTNTASTFVLNGNAVHLTGNINNFSPNTQTINLPLVLDTFDPTFHAAAGNIVINGNIGETNGPLGFAKTGAHTVVLNGVNTYTGTVEIRAGALRANDGTGLAPGSHLQFNGGVLEGNGIASFTRNVGPVAGQVEWAGDGGFSAHGGTLTVNLGGAAAPVTWGGGSFVPAGNKLLFSAATANGTVQFVNPINLGGGLRTIQVANGSAIVDVDLIGGLTGSGGSGWIKTGAGALNLSGASSYDGVTLVNGGTLLVNNALTSGGGVTVNAGGVLGGTGTVNSAVTVAGHGVLAPGMTGAGVFEAASTLTLQNNFIYDWQLGATTNDVVAAGSITFADGDQWTLRLGTEADLLQTRPDLFGASHSNDVYVLMSWETGATPWGLTNALLVGNGRFILDNAQVFINEANQQVLLTGVWLIPEPNTLVLLFAGAFTIWRSRRRKRRQQQ